MKKKNHRTNQNVLTAPAHRKPSCLIPMASFPKAQQRQQKIPYPFFYSFFDSLAKAAFAIETNNTSFFPYFSHPIHLLHFLQCLLMLKSIGIELDPLY